MWLSHPQAKPAVSGNQWSEEAEEIVKIVPSRQLQVPTFCVLRGFSFRRSPMLLPSARISLSSFTPPLCRFILPHSTPHHRTTTTLGFHTVTQLSSFSDSLRACAQSSNLPHGESLHAHLLKTPLLATSIFLQNHLLNLYLKCRHSHAALNLFDEMPHRNLVSYTSLINALPHRSLSFFSQMRRAGITPNAFTFVGALHASSSTNDIHLINQLYSLIIQFGFDSNVFVSNSFLSSLIKNNELPTALMAFESSPVKDTVTWNTILDGFSRLHPSDVPTFWLRMIRQGIKPDAFSFSTVLSGLAELSSMEMAVQVHAHLLKLGHGGETGVANSLLNIYSKSGNLINAFIAFNEIHHKNVLTWTSMASGCINCGEPNTALNIIQQMRKSGVKPNKYTLSTALNACASLGALSEGKKFHGLRIKLGDNNDGDHLLVDNSLLDMYMKCGSLHEPVLIFSKMRTRSVVSWTAMIMGFADNGRSKESLEIFDEMVQSGLAPNHVTFVGVLGACARAGWVREGRRRFDEMRSVYGVEPGEDHYVCMVGLLGRSGNIREAEEMVLGMPVQGSGLAWQALLGACCVHGELETGRRAAERAVEVGGGEPSTYVLLSNMLAGSGRWDGVEALRRAMGSRGVGKVAGSSRFE